MTVLAFSRGLAARPASSLLPGRQRAPRLSNRLPTLWSSSQYIRFASSSTEESSTAQSGNTTAQNAQPSSSSSSSSDAAPTEQQKASETPTTSKSTEDVDFDDVIKSLNLSNQRAAQFTQRVREGEAESARVAAQVRPSAPPPGRRALPGSTFNMNPLKLSEAVGKSAQTQNYRAPIRRIDLKLGPTLGRQVYVDPDRGMELSGALRALNSQLAQNRVRAQSNQQKFHVRKGQRRKDLRRERWRKLFKVSFNATVAKIQRMRAQGW